MTKDEALKLALEALEESKTTNDTMEFHNRKNKAITAIKEALAQPGDGVEQEPAGFVRNDGEAYWIHDSPPPGTDLYTTPPAQPEQEFFGYFQYSIQLDAWVQNRINNKGVAFFITPPKEKNT